MLPVCSHQPEAAFLNFYGAQKSIPPAYVAWWTGTRTLLFLGFWPPYIVKKFQHWSSGRKNLRKQPLAISFSCRTTSCVHEHHYVTQSYIALISGALYCSKYVVNKNVCLISYVLYTVQPSLAAPHPHPIDIKFII